MKSQPQNPEFKNNPEKLHFHTGVRIANNEGYFRKSDLGLHNLFFLFKSCMKKASQNDDDN